MAQQLAPHIIQLFETLKTAIHEANRDLPSRLSEFAAADLVKALSAVLELETALVVNQAKSLEEETSWKTAVEEMLIANCLDPFEKGYENPALAIQRLIDHEVRLALDPAVSLQAQELIEQGRGQVVTLEPALEAPARDYRKELYISIVGQIAGRDLDSIDRVATNAIKHFDEFFAEEAPEDR